MTRRVVYSPGMGRLVYLHERASPEYWDNLWRSQGKPPPVSARDDVIHVTRQFLPPGARVLEGGCGRANKVKALVDAGYCAIGVDFAEDSVRQALLDYPGLDVRSGDVRRLDFPGGYFDGYWSIGVIEHFWDGYEAILVEAARVLRPGGFLFLTAPWLSPWRKWKARSGGYEHVNFQTEPESFYQFALSRDEVAGQLSRHGFQLLRWRGRHCDMWMLEDLVSLQRQVNWLLRSRGSVMKRAVRRVLTSLLNPWCGHSFLAVARRS